MMARFRIKKGEPLGSPSRLILSIRLAFLVNGLTITGGKYPKRHDV
ncbi:hypothetical protein V12B01_13185 [Vibrio splendidus 12B01]|nr:hypothetical protein V12B01_13185 [Vibrio splendidus 12B01]